MSEGERVASPGRHLPWLFGAALPLGLAGGPLAWAGLLAANGALGGLALRDARALRSAPPTVQRLLPDRLVVGEAATVTLAVRNPSRWTLRLELRDAAPASLGATPAVHHLTLGPGERRSVTYTVTPTRRGDHAFGPSSLRVERRPALAALTLTLPLEGRVRVYPALVSLPRAELALVLRDARMMGARAARIRGGGGDLAELREYVAGDAFRHLSWKATAKRGRPVTRVFEQERSQQVVLCVDASRTMATGIGGVAKLDHALGSALLLARVALERGDRVGVMVFSDRIVRYVPPDKGRAHYGRLLDGLYDVEASTAHADFRALSAAVRARIARRSLLVIFSDLETGEDVHPLVQHAGMLRARHLPLCVALADEALAERASAPAADARALCERAAAISLCAERAGHARALQKSAVAYLEAPPGGLAVAAVERYLSIKSRGAL